MKGAVGVKGPWTPEEISIRERLEQMVKLPENQECADCTARAPKWAVFNHGIFVCIKCSGQHRGLGAAISKVRSISLDRWKPDQFAQMCGNAAANARLLYNLPAGMQKPQEEDDQGRYKWIQQKYVKKTWQWREDQPPPAGQPPPAQVQEQKHVEQIPQQLQFRQQSNQLIQSVPQPVVIQPIQQNNGGNNALLDLFGDFNGPNVPAVQIQQQKSHAQLPVNQKPQIQQTPVSAPVSNNASSKDDIFADIFGESSVVAQPQPQQQPQQQFIQYQQPVQFQPPVNTFQVPNTKFNPTAFLISNQQQQPTDYKPIGFNW